MLGLKDLCFGAASHGRWGSFAQGAWEKEAVEVYPVK